MRICNKLLLLSFFATSCQSTPTSPTTPIHVAEVQAEHPEQVTLSVSNDPQFEKALLLIKKAAKESDPFVVHLTHEHIMVGDAVLAKTEGFTSEQFDHESLNARLLELKGARRVTVLRVDALALQTLNFLMCAKLQNGAFDTGTLINVVQSNYGHYYVDLSDLDEMYVPYAERTNVVAVVASPTQCEDESRSTLRSGVEHVESCLLRAFNDAPQRGEGALELKRQNGAWIARSEDIALRDCVESSDMIARLPDSGSCSIDIRAAWQPSNQGHWGGENLYEQLGVKHEHPVFSVYITRDGYALRRGPGNTIAVDDATLTREERIRATRLLKHQRDFIEGGQIEEALEKGREFHSFYVNARPIAPIIAAKILEGEESSGIQGRFTISFAELIHLTAGSTFDIVQSIHTDLGDRMYPSYPFGSDSSFDSATPFFVLPE